VLVADDHPALRAAVKRTLESSGYVVCAESDTAPGAVEAAVRERPDLCLLDIQMPGNGLWAAAEIVAQVPESAVVMLTVSQDERDLFEALRAGAVGYLLKDTDPERLPHALRGVLSGEAALPRTLVRHLIREFQQRGQRRHLFLPGRRRVDLTAREGEVLDLLRRGLSTAEIAKRLSVSAVTVRRHIGSVLAKLDEPDRKSALALLATHTVPTGGVSHPRVRRRPGAEESPSDEVPRAVVGDVLPGRQPEGRCAT
jgi:DNA-binding NarL/FixJ family response regulator